MVPRKDLFALGIASENSYVIDDITGTYNDPHKIKLIVQKLKENFSLEAPIFKTSTPLAALNSIGKKESEYKMETYRLGKSKYVLILEYFGELGNHLQLKQHKQWHHIVVTLTPSNIELQNLIEEIISS